MTKIAAEFEIYQGETTRLRVPITDRAGTAVSLTGATLTWMAFSPKSSTTAAITKSSSDDGITLEDGDDTDDVVVVHLPKAATSGLAVGKYYHECRVVSAETEDQVVFSGQFEIHKSKTL